MSKPDRVALITGASRGIGASIREVFQSHGVQAVDGSRTKTHPDAVVLDVRDENSVRQCLDEVLRRYGRLDILVNNAGIVSQSAITECALAEWQDVLATNLTGAFLCIKHAVRHFLTAGGGVIVNVSSIAGRSFSATASEAYTCSKYGLVGLTRQLAHRYAAQNIRVNCVCPSQTLTPMLEGALTEAQIAALARQNPAGRLAQPIEIAAAVWFLASPEAAYINGAVLDVNGGKL